VTPRSKKKNPLILAKRGVFGEEKRLEKGALSNGREKVIRMRPEHEKKQEA